jgi:hypothetical protein
MRNNFTQKIRHNNSIPQNNTISTAHDTNNLSHGQGNIQMEKYDCSNDFLLLKATSLGLHHTIKVPLEHELKQEVDYYNNDYKDKTATTPAQQKN